MQGDGVLVGIVGGKVQLVAASTACQPAGARKESIRKKSNGKKETIFARIKSNRKKSNSTKFI